MKPVILYHAGCYDGFGGAFAAWKKFGNDAVFISCRQQDPLPDGVEGADVYLIDFCFPKEVLAELQNKAASVVVLDHHRGNRDLIQGNPDWRYSEKRSGAGLAWEYFHPERPMPLFLQYIEEGDLWRYTLPHSEILKYWTHIQPFDFQLWDKLSVELEDPDRFRELVATARAYGEYFDWIVSSFQRRAQMVLFEGHKVPAIQAPRFIRSQLGHRLAKDHPFAIVWTVLDNKILFSLRGDGAIDLSSFAVKYNGNGHPRAAGFFLPIDLPLPFTPVES